MRSKTFRIGGIHPDENKLSNDSVTKQAPLPKIAVYSLSQHIGAPAQAIVKAGDTVTRGQMIAQPAQGLSVGIHASVNGKVTEVTDRYIIIAVN